MASTTSKRPSTVVAGPRPPLDLVGASVIHETAQVIGTHPIRIGINAVIHPRAKLNSAHGPVKIDDFCIICERSQVGIQESPDEDDSMSAEGVSLGKGVIVEVEALVEGKSIGDGTVLEVHSKVGRGAVIGKHCKIGPYCSVAEGDVLEDHTIVYGWNQRRVDRSGVDETRMKMNERHTQVLRSLIPSKPAKFIS